MYVEGSTGQSRTEDFIDSRFLQNEEVKKAFFKIFSLL